MEKFCPEPISAIIFSAASWPIALKFFLQTENPKFYLSRTICQETAEKTKVELGLGRNFPMSTLHPTQELQNYPHPKYPKIPSPHVEGNSVIN